MKTFPPYFHHHLAAMKNAFVSLQLFALVFVLAALLGACNSGQSSEYQGPPKRHNSVVLLDLSDRLLTKNQPQRDQKLIGQLIANFQQTVKDKAYIGSSDRFKVAIAPQKIAPYDPAPFHDRLYLNLGKMNVQHKRFVADSLTRLRKTLEALYTQAASGEKSSDYHGADLWRYLKDFAQMDFPKSMKFEDQKHLLILTDGYLNFESYHGRRQQSNRYASTRFVYQLARKKENWRKAFEENDYGVMSLPEQPLKGVSVTVAEVDPKADYHFEILKATWKKWLKEAGAKEVRVYRKGPLPAILEQVGQMPS